MSQAKDSYRHPLAALSTGVKTIGIVDKRSDFRLNPCMIFSTFDVDLVANALLPSCLYDRTRI